MILELLKLNWTRIPDADSNGEICADIAKIDMEKINQVRNKEAFAKYLKGV